MLRLTLAALVLALPVGEALAQHHPAIPGAIAGRSPHAAYRPASSAGLAEGCTVAAPGGPSGRLASHVARARSDAGCAQIRLATAEESRATGRD